MGRLIVLAAAVAVLVPLAGSSVPPLVDYPDHLARMLILSRLQTAPMAEVFAADPHFIPNLAMETVVLPLAHVLPLELAGRVFIALAMLLPVAGCAALHRVLHPRAAPTPWPLAASLLACNAVLTTGLLGFAVGTGAALVATAILLRGSRPHVAALLGIAVFACHAVAFVLLLVLLGPALAYRRVGWRPAAMTLLPLIMAPLILFAAFGPHAGQRVDLAAAASALLQAGPGLKIRALWLFAPFASPGGWPYLDIPVAVVFAFILIAARGRLGLAPEVLPAVLALTAAWAILPDSLLGDGVMFERMAWPAALLVIAGTDPRPPRGVAVPAVALCALLLVVRGVVAAHEWAGQNARLADLRTALASVPAGARILAVRDGAELWHADSDEGPGSQAFHKLVAYARLPALPIAEHAAFWPMMFTEPGKSPLRFRAPYDQMAQHDGPLPLTSMLFGPPPRPIPEEETAQLADWRHRYDYVLRLHPRGAFENQSLAEQASTSFAVLYRIKPAAAIAAPDAPWR